MERVPLTTFVRAARLIRDPVLIVQTFPRNHPRYGEEIELGEFIPRTRAEQEGAGGSSQPSGG